MVLENIVQDEEVFIELLKELERVFTWEQS